MVVMLGDGGDFGPGLTPASDDGSLFYDTAFSVKTPFSRQFFLLRTDVATSSFGLLSSLVSTISGEPDSWLITQDLLKDLCPFFTA